MPAKGYVWGIDATNRVHMLWHATHSVTSTVDQFRRDLDSLRKHWTPKLLAVAFDSPTCFRRSLEPSYKAHRAEKPPELRQALELAADAVCDARISYLCVDGAEADDCLASLAALSSERGEQCVILSPDKDLRQCLLPAMVSIRKTWSPWTNSDGWLTARCLLDDTGLRPDQWIDYQCLVGDGGDGIRGAAGIGEKTAAAWLQVAPLDELLRNRWLVKMSERQYQSLAELGRRLDVVRRLVTLRTDLPCVVDCFDAITPAVGASA